MIWMGWLQSEKLEDGVLHRHHQSPVAEGGGVLPSQTREKTASYPAALFLTQKVEDFFGWRDEYLVLAPPGPPISTLGKALNQVVILVGTRNIPHLPHTVGVDEIGLVDTAALPVFVGDKDWGRLVSLFAAVPFEIADGVRTPEIFGCACVVDSLDPVACMRVRAFYV